MKRIVIIFLLALFVASGLSAGETTRKERRYVMTGNKLYKEGKYKEAAKEYQLALSINPSFAAAKYNLALSCLRLAASPDTPEKQKEDILNEGKAGMADISALGASDPKLAAKANYNLGNVAFNSQQYKESIDYYKMALRFNPEDNAARRNLRIAQKKLQQQNQDQNKDNKDQNKDNKDQNKDQQDKNQNQDQNKDNKDQNDKQQEEQQNALSNRTMDQILKSSENRENATRARVNATNNGRQKENNGGRRLKNW